MGNIGRSSTGCYLCRKRKIKCDEGRPGCRKCAQIRKTCPGYPFSVELNVRSDTSSSSTSHIPRAAVRPSVLIHSLSESRVPQTKPAAPLVVPVTVPDTPETSGPHIQIIDPHFEESDFECEIRAQSSESELQDGRSTSVKLEGPVMDRSLSVVPAHPNPVLPPKYDVQHQSTCFFINLFCFQASQTYGAPILDYLPGMLLQSKPDSCLHLALKAVSRMSLADRYSGCDVRLQTGKEYVKALSATKAAIRHSSEAVKDETFIAVWLLGLYENINSVLSHGRFDRQHRTPEEEYQSHISHIRGAMNLLRVRGRSQLDNGRSEKIYRIFKAAIQMRLFNLNSVESNDFENLEYDVYQQEHEFLPSKSARNATNYFHTCAHLLEQAKYTVRKHKELPDYSDEIAEDLQETIDQAEALDAEMNGWYKHDDEAGWEMMRVHASTRDTMWALYPSHATYHFYNFWVFLYWLRYFVARVKLYEGMIVIVRCQKEVVMRERQSSTSPTEYNRRRSSVNNFDFKIQQYRTVIQLVAGQIIGLTAYALGDITNQGTFYSSLHGSDPSAGIREVNVIAGLQLVIPLKVLQRSDSPTPTQRGAIDLALSHIGDGFRRQPLLI